MLLTKQDLLAIHGQPAVTPAPAVAPVVRPQFAHGLPPAPAVKGPTDPQLAYIAKLQAARVGGAAHQLPPGATGHDASKLIDTLKGLPKIAPVQAPAAPESPSGSGKVETTVALREGYYTVSHEDGTHTTIRIHRQDDDASFMPGKLVLGHLTGSDNENDYTSFGNLTSEGQARIWKRFQTASRLIAAVRVLTGDPKASARAYAQESGRCYRCNRLLTTPESIADGLGPVCAERGW